MPPKPPKTPGPPKPPKPSKRPEPHPFLIKLIINPNDGTLQVGESQQFTVIGQFSNGSIRDLTGEAHYKSSNPNVVSVDRKGLAMAISTGSSEITATIA